MELKLRLQRVLQILEDAERSGAMSELEKDMVLTELREAYSEVKFGVVACEKQEEKPVVIAPVLPTPEPEPVVEDNEPEVEDEPEMEVEIIFNEEDEEEVESEELREESEIETPIETPAEIETPTVVEQPVVEEPAVEAPAVVEAPEEVVVYEAPAEEETEEETEVEEQPIVEEKVEKTAVVDELSTLHSPLSTPTHSAILSLYDDAPAVIGEQFRETTSVADTIVCPKGVAESTPITSLRSAIGVADKFMFVRELFNGDSEAYESAITALESQPSFDDCIIYISENYAWAPNGEGTKLMMELLQRKYNA